MTIDIERLKVDREYWDEVAPKSATHYIIDNAPDLTFHPAFHVEENDRYRECGCRAYWDKEEGMDMLKVIPRPEPRQAERKATEYGTLINPNNKEMVYGQDHVGREVEVLRYLVSEKVYVVRFDWGLGCVDYDMIDWRTKEKRQRDELEAIAHECSYDPRDIATAILTHYNLEPKQ